MEERHTSHLTGTLRLCKAYVHILIRAKTTSNNQKTKNETINDAKATFSETFKNCASIIKAKLMIELM